MNRQDNATALQARAHRRMTGEQRLLVALDMSSFVLELAAARLRKAFPASSDRQIAMALHRVADAH